MSLARYGIKNGMKVPVEDVTSAAIRQLDPFSVRALGRSGFLRIAEKITSGEKLNRADISRLLQNAGFPVLMKLVSINSVTPKQCTLLLRDKSCDFPEEISVSGQVRFSETSCEELWIKGIRRIEVPFDSTLVNELRSFGFNLDLVSNFDADATFECVLREFEKLLDVLEEGEGILSWMPVMTKASRTYTLQGARDFQLLRCAAIGRLLSGDALSIRLALPNLSADAANLANYAGVECLVSDSPEGKVGEYIFVKKYQAANLSKNIQ